MFVVLIKVSDEDRKLPSPFTQPPTASLLVERERQAKERALPPGSSKLRKLRGHSEQNAEKVVPASGLQFYNFNASFYFFYL